MSPPENQSPQSPSLAKDAAQLLVALIVMAGAMSLYWLYPFPSGHKPDVWGFLALFFKEVLLLAFFAGCGLLLLIAVAIRSLVRLTSALWTRGK